MKNLFQVGDFTLSSGARSSWKIECDALTPDDWQGLAHIAMEIICPKFGYVSYVPNGGKSLADAMRRYAERGSVTPLLCEDVGTTFASMEKRRKELGATRIIGLVAFARAEPPEWVRVICRIGP